MVCKIRARLDLLEMNPILYLSSRRLQIGGKLMDHIDGFPSGDRIIVRPRNTDPPPKIGKSARMRTRGVHQNTVQIKDQQIKPLSHPLNRCVMMVSNDRNPSNTVALLTFSGDNEKNCTGVSKMFP